MSAIVFEDKKVAGPVTHAIVIGVGHYAHLPGGAGNPKFDDPDGLGQLKSPPVSARAFAQWVVESYQNADRPLRSVSLLISEKDPQKFTFQRGAAAEKSVAVQTATMQNVEDALTEWHALGGKNPDNLLLFYFCGHGIAAGDALALVMEDFGAKPKAPLKGALDFRAFYRGMDECDARHQCYFLDACRVGSTLLKENDGAGTQNPINATGNYDPPGGKLRLGPVFHSTLAGAPAYAQPKRPSVFTAALIESLQGAGSGDEDGPWRVGTTRLQEALDFLMLQASRELEMPQDQIPSTDAAAKIPLNTLDTPAVPVVIRVLPAEAHPKAVLRCESDTRKEKRTPPSEDPWRLSLPAARYKFFADFKNGEHQAQPVDDWVRPPYWNKPLKVTP